MNDIHIICTSEQIHQIYVPEQQQHIIINVDENEQMSNQIQQQILLPTPISTSTIIETNHSIESESNNTDIFDFYIVDFPIETAENDTRKDK